MIRTKHNPLRESIWTILKIYGNNSTRPRYSITANPRDMVIKDNITNEESKIVLQAGTDSSCPYYIYLNELTGAIVTQLTLSYINSSDPQIIDSKTTYELIKTPPRLGDNRVTHTVEYTSDVYSACFKPGDVISYGHVLMIGGDAKIILTFFNERLSMFKIPCPNTLITIQQFPIIEGDNTDVINVWDKN